MKVPFVDLSRSFSKELMMFAFEQVMDSGAFVYGPQITEFENKLTDYLGVEGAVGLSSGTAALELALKSLGIGRYDKVLVPANSFVASAFAVSNVGAIPVFCDVDPGSWLMSLDSVKKAFDEYERIFAVIPVHLFGRAIPDISKIVNYCHQRGTFVVEDCAQALGAESYWEGKRRKIGTFGDINCFSFYPTKTLGCFGNGGAVAGNKIGYLNQVRFLRSYGFDEKKKYLSQCVGTNANMDTLQAVVLNEMLPGLNDLNKSRTAAAGTYTQRMSDLGLFQYLTVQNTSNLEGPHYRDHVYHLFVIRLNDPSKRDRLLDYLRSKDIGCAVHYQLPIHQQPAYSRLDRVRLPNVESLAASMISLPLFPYITREEIYYVCETIREFFSNA